MFFVENLDLWISKISSNLTPVLTKTQMITPIASYELLKRLYRK
ncbi:hypothetical protein VCHA29O37_30092 [Vibrio chagasii]|nr:hypothetical protein VCHA29O37_30092 [Vibrio chagasii]